MSGQTRLVTELYSLGQASMVLARLSPARSSTALSKFFEVVLLPHPHITPLTSSTELGLV